MSTGARQPLVTSDPATPLVVTGDITDQEQNPKWICDVQVGGAIVPFLRLFRFNPDGTVATPAFVDIAEDGTPYVVTGTVTNCAQAIAQGAQSGLGGDPVYTRVFGNGGANGTHTTDANARRVQVFWTSTAAALGNRATIAIAGGGSTALPNNVGLVEFGTLDSITPLGYTVTVQTNQNNDDAGVLEEF